MDSLLGSEEPRKRCIRCGESKSLSGYHRDVRRKDGLNPYCKPCVREYLALTRDPQKDKARRLAYYHAVGKQRREAKRQAARADGVKLGRKQCTVCGAIRGREDFRADGRAIDGLHRRCKMCDAARKAARAHKRCPRCGAVKDRGQFHTAKSRSDGLDCWCKTCRSIVGRVDWQKHVDKRREKGRRYQKAHPERALVKSERNRVKNYVRTLERGRRWNVAHAAQHRLRQARRADAIANGVSASDWASILECFNRCCAYCLRDDVKLGMDHVTPLYGGGEHVPENIVPACRRCNSRKGHRPIFTMARYL